MKKLISILFIMFLSLSFQLKGQEISQEPDANQIIDKVFDRTTEVIQELSLVLQVPAKHVYSVLVKQQTVIGYCTGIALLITLIFTILIILLGVKEDWGKEWFIVGSWVLGVMSFIMTIVFLVEGVSRLINPEYGAIIDILSILN